MEPPIDLHDWELLSESDSALNPKSSESIDQDSDDGAIKADYFSPHPIKPQQSDDEIDEGSIDSDNPSSLDPDFDTTQHSKGQLDLSIENSRSVWSDASSEGPISVAGNGEEEVGGGGLVKDDSLESFGGGGDGNGERVWWSMPMKMLKLWVLRVRPVWSISIAVAIVGVVMLGRRLYRMKQKGRSIPLKIAIDDKKTSQFMARVARLNEAFSVVKRVPIIRPSLPAGSSISSWPMASLR